MDGAAVCFRCRRVALKVRKYKQQSAVLEEKSRSLFSEAARIRS